MRVSGKVAYALKPWGEASSFWKGGPDRDPVTVTQNVFGDAGRRARQAGALAHSSREKTLAHALLGPAAD